MKKKTLIIVGVSAIAIIVAVKAYRRYGMPLVGYENVDWLKSEALLVVNGKRITLSKEMGIQTENPNYQVEWVTGNALSNEADEIVLMRNGAYYKSIIKRQPNS